jgi:hypothetical protein
MLGKAGRLAVSLGILLFLPRVAAAEDVMEFSLDEAAGDAPRAGKVQAADADAEVAKALGQLRWGMSSKELLAMFKARLRAEYEHKSKLERDILRQDALYQEASARYDTIKSNLFQFDDKKNGWDVSTIAAEFRRGSRESMLVVRSAQSNDYYFFIHDKLWKWYREIEPSHAGAAGFDGLAEMMQGQLGAVAQQHLARTDGGPTLPGLAWDATTTRVTLLQRGATACLIFEAQHTLAELPALRQNAIARVTKRHSVIDDVVMDTAAQEEWRNEVDTTRSPVDAITKKKQLSATR